MPCRAVRASFVRDCWPGKYFLQHLKWVLRKKACWADGLSPERLLKTMAGSCVSVTRVRTRTVTRGCVLVRGVVRVGVSVLDIRVLTR